MLCFLFFRPVDGAQDAQQGSHNDTAVNAYTENVIAVRFLELDIADSLGVGTDADCVFVVVDKFVAGDANF